MSATKSPFSDRHHRLFSPAHAPGSGRLVLSGALFFSFAFAAFGFTYPGAAAGAVDGPQEQSFGQPMLQAPDQTPKIDPVEVLQPAFTNPLPATAPPPIPPAPAAAPGIKTDTIAPREFRIDNDDRSTLEIPLTGAPTESERENRVINGNVAIRIDGRMTEKTSINQIDPENIRSIDVIKDKDALKKLNLERYDALLDIVTNDQPTTLPLRTTDDRPVTTTKNIAYFIDGIKLNPNPMNNLNPDYIEKINVVKGEKEMERRQLGEYEGAIFITLKPGVRKKFWKEFRRAEAERAAGKQ